MAESGKSCLKGCLIVGFVGSALAAGLFGLLVYLGVRDQNARAAAADAFFRQAQQGDLKGAYERAAAGFRKARTLEQTRALLEEKKLTGFKSAKWRLADRGPNREVAIRGTVQLQDGGTVPLRVLLAKEADGYRVLDITDPLPEPAPKPVAKKAPAEEKKTGVKKSGFSWTSAKFKNVRLTASAARDATPQTRFPSDAKEIYCLAELAWVPSGTKVTAKWFFCGKDGEKLLIERSVVADSSVPASFRIYRTERRFWTKGKYRVRLYINDKERRSLDFIIRDPTLPELRRKAKGGDAEAAFGIYALHLRGGVDDPGEREALGWLRKAAESGHAVAQYNLGVLCTQGKGVTRDLKAAAVWYRKAAEQGHPGAEYNLAVCYREGAGVAKSLTEAVVWTRKAAEHGSPDAQFNMGVHYGTGAGVPRDPAEAARWLRKAAAQGHERAKKALGAAAAPPP